MVQSMRNITNPVVVICIVESFIFFDYHYVLNIQSMLYYQGNIMNAGFETYYDNATGTNIGYMTGASKDGWTAGGCLDCISREGNSS